MSAVTAVPLRPLAKGSVLKLWVGLALLALAALALGWLGTRGLQRTTTASGLQYQVIRDGEGNLITDADMVALNFVGRHENGEIFADTRRDRPVEVAPDNSPVPGLGEGLKLMRKGSVYRFWVPPNMYRGQLPANAPFGPNEMMIFDVQVIDVAPGMAAMQRVQQMQELQRQLQSGGEGGNTAAPAPEGGNAAASVPAAPPR